MSNSNKYILTGGKDRRVILWDVQTGKKLNMYNQHQDSVTTVSISPDEKMILASTLDGET